jgi:integrase/recombinase XerD
VSNATIRRDLTAVSSVLEFAIDREWREGNPALERAKKLNERRDPITLPTEASLAFVLTRCEPHWVAIINAARYTGCRLDELRNLEHRDFSAANATLTIRQGKGNKRRTIDLIPEAIEALKILPPSKTTNRLLHIAGAPMADASSGFRSKVKWAHNAAQKASLEFAPFRFHDLRHLFAVEALQRRMSIYDLQQHLGHVSIKTTEEYLSFLTPEQAKIAKGITK